MITDQSIESQNLFIFENRKTGRHDHVDDTQLQRDWQGPVLPLQPEYRLGHPESYYSLLSLL